jgi:hypothetical protein
MCKKLKVAYVELISRNFPTEAEVNHENLSHRFPVSGRKFGDLNTGPPGEKQECCLLVGDVHFFTL